MLSSIHPLGERARHNRWGLTVTAYLLGSWAGGLAVFALAAAAGAALPDAAHRPLSIAAAAAAVVLELRALTGRRLLGPRRQVNEDWLTRYRGWVYGAGFGLQLGAGLATIVTSAALYLALALTFVAGDLRAAAVVGTVYGLGRAVPLIAARRVRQPEHLAALHARLRHAARPVQLASTAALTVLGIAVMGFA
jgi:hypothetical protein